MIKREKFLAPMVALLICAPTAEAQVNAVIYPDKDAIIHGCPGCDGSNYGTSTVFECASWTSMSIDYYSRGLIQFDLSSIPPGSVILDASLRLYGFDHFIISQSTLSYLLRITQDWNETMVSWNDQPTTTGTAPISLSNATTTGQDYTLDVTDHVQDMLDNPADNYGFMLQLQTEGAPYARLRFVSSDSLGSSDVPKLSVTYAPPVRFATLQEVPDGSVYMAYEGKLKFRYGEPNQPGSLTYKIYDELHEVVMDDGNYALPKSFGTNWFIIDLNEDEDFVEDDYYLLEVMDEYGKSEYLRFQMAGEDADDSRTTNNSWIMLQNNVKPNN